MGRLTVLFLLTLVVSVVSKRGGGSKGGFSWGKAGGSSNKGGSSNSKGSSSQGSHSAPANYPRQPQVPNQNPPPYPGRGGNPAPGGYPAQGGYPPQGGYPAQGNYPGRSGYPGQGGYPAQGSYPGGSYPNRNPGQAGGYGNPYPGGGSYPGYPNRGGSYPGGGVAGAGAGAYPGAAQYPYWNPNNKIMSPGYGGNYGGQGYGGGRSPFAQSVQNMGMAPSYNSRGFGRQAVMAAGVGAVAGMALGYGLGSFPRPHFNFHNPQEEYYYNNYMYRRYGQTPPNGNVNQNGNTNSQGGRPVDSGLTPEGQGKVNPYDIFQNTPPQSFDNFMDKCIKRTDLLRQESRSRRFTEFPEPEATLGGELGVEDNSPSVAQEDAMSNNSTVEKATSETSSDTTSFVTSKLSETQSQPQRQIQEIAAEEAKEDDDTVSIMEIGYPVLIEQMKARRCVELYMVYAEQHAEKQMQQRSNIDDQTNSGSGDLHGPLSHGVMLLLTSILACYL